MAVSNENTGENTAEMTDKMTLSIAKHAVAQLESGLSPLQQDLLDHPAKIRLVDAPTGAGKTYAFQRGLVTRNQRILFIVPTRRLAQNIAGGLVNDLVQHDHWTVEVAEKKVAVWSSDQSRQLDTEGIENVRGFRIRQLQALDATRTEGEMIVAIPEVVSHLLLARTLDMGHAGMGVFDVLNAFDHIVFDEFHTIEARGFGLAALFAKLAPHFGRAKISFLSATPVNNKPVLLRLGVEAEHIAELSETLVKKGRWLHGNVQLTIADTPSMHALIQQQMALIQQEVTAQRQVVIIYNALGDLRRDLIPLARQFNAAGIAAEQVLVINSIDDSGGNNRLQCGFHVGQKRNPDDFSVLIATASVEIGVTFRAANVMLMESGFEPMNFLQRYGRAARRGQDGQVFVRVDNDSKNRNPWLRAITSWVEQHQNSTQSIQALTRVVSESVVQPSGVDNAKGNNNDTHYFGELAKQADYIAGLYWQVLMKHPSNKGYRGQHLWQHQPKSSKVMYALLKAVRQLENHEDYGQYCEQWLKHLYGQALRYRDIGKRVLVIEGNGRRVHVSRLWLARETDLLQFWQEDEEGNEYYPITGELDDYLLDDKNRASRELDTYFPHKPDVATLTADAGLVNNWCRLLLDKRDMDTEYALEDCPEAMQAAEKIVRLTGLVPSDESVLSDEAMVGIMG